MSVVIPSGLHPLGLWVPQTYAPKDGPPGILADSIDPKTGEFTSISKGMDPIDQQVVLAMRITRRSGAAVMNDGQEFREIRKVTEETPILMKSVAERALRRLIEQGDIELGELETNGDGGDDFAEVVINYTNKRARGRQDRRAVLP